MGRPLKKLPTLTIVKAITRIRGRNNRLWMNLLKLAVTSKPRKAKNIILSIQKNDKDVTKWMSRL